MEVQRKTVTRKTGVEMGTGGVGVIDRDRVSDKRTFRGDAGVRPVPTGPFERLKIVSKRLTKESTQVGIQQ